MSKALRCDMCKEIYDFYNQTRKTSHIFTDEEPFYIEVQVTARWRTIAWPGGTTPAPRDICETCMKDLMLDWMKGESNE